MDAILQEISEKIKDHENTWIDGIKQGFHFEEIENTGMGILSSSFTKIIEKLLSEVLSDENLLEAVLIFAGKSAFKFIGYRKINVYLKNGAKCLISSPYFTKATPKRGDKKKGPNNRV